MKPALCLLLLTFLLSCKKEEASFKKQIIGKWELHKSYGGFTPTINEYPPGNGHIKIFTETEFTEYHSGQILEQGLYTVVDTVWNGEKGGIIYINSALLPYFFKVNNSKLSLSWLGADGGGSEYRKIK